jgi:hypothetical protein
MLPLSDPLAIPCRIKGHWLLLLGTFRESPDYAPFEVYSDIRETMGNSGLCFPGPCLPLNGVWSLAQGSSLQPSHLCNNAEREIVNV